MELWQMYNMRYISVSSNVFLACADYVNCYYQRSRLKVKLFQISILCNFVPSVESGVLAGQTLFGVYHQRS